MIVTDKRMNRGRQGSLFLIMLGLLSVMILIGLSLHQRFSRQNQFLTMSDHTQIARYFLESYAGDVLRHVKEQANRPGSAVYNAFRVGGLSERTINTGYQPDPLLKELLSETGVTSALTPKVELAGLSALPYPSMVTVPGPLQNLEVAGMIRITCTCEYFKRTYTLDVEYPYKVVMRLVPILREFLLFADKMHLEQTQPIGPGDGINILFTRQGDNPVPAPAAYQQFQGKPFLLSFNGPNAVNRDKVGRVYLGPDDRDLFLNLAGEVNFRQELYSELWQVPPKSFAVNTAGKPFQPVAVIKGKDGSDIQFRGLEVPLKHNQAAMGLLGFCEEVADTSQGPFADSPLDVEDAIGNQDPAMVELLKDRKRMALSSALKLFGPNLEMTLPSTTSYSGPAREVFGNVYNRYFIISMFIYPSQLGPQPLIYQTNANYQPDPFPRFFGYAPVPFEPLAGRYGDYMSRVVSGGYDTMKDTWLPANKGGGSTIKCLTSADFHPADSMGLNGRFDAFAAEWLKIDTAAPVEPKSIQTRIGEYFKTQAEFKEFVGINRSPARFWVDGVHYVDEKLELGDLTLPDAQIRGGVILVNGPITLGNITRGLAPTIKADDPAVKHELDQLTQDRFLTFVSVSGDTITLTGDLHVGVHLISMKSDVAAKKDQIRWVKGENVRFFGGLAVNTLNLTERIKQFKQVPRIEYPAVMADPKPATAVQISSTPGGYQFYVP